MDESIKGFYTKNAEQNYAAQYELDHGVRLDAMVAHWNLKEFKNQRVLDVGGGLGFLGKRLDVNNDYWVIDGADVFERDKLCKGRWIKRDLDFEKFSDPVALLSGGRENPRGFFDTGFILETLEHLTNPYHCLAEMKKLVKEDGDIYISIPHVNVTHNYIYPALMVDPNNFAQFLGQMALPVADYWLWNRGWNAHHFKCKNRPYSEKIMLYPKTESKFVNATPVEMVNW